MGKRDFQKEHTTDILKEMVIARLEKGGETFEILIDSNCVDEIRSNPEASVLIILVANCQSQEMSFFNMNCDSFKLPPIDSSLICHWDSTSPQ